MIDFQKSTVRLFILASFMGSVAFSGPVRAELYYVPGPSPGTEDLSYAAMHQTDPNEVRYLASASDSRDSRTEQTPSTIRWSDSSCNDASDKKDDNR